MTKRKAKITANGRLLSDVLPSYKTTFDALKELINNSFKAKASLVNIVFEGNDVTVVDHAIECIRVIDNGIGVPLCDFEHDILEVATDNNNGGKGIGRFSAFQIGREMAIETVGVDTNLNKKTKVSFKLSVDDLKNTKIEDKDIEYNDHATEKIEGNTYYKVSLLNLYNNEEGCPNKNKLGDLFNEDKFKEEIVKSYPFQIFNDEIRIQLNGQDIKKDDYIIGEPQIVNVDDYKDVKGCIHPLCFSFYNVKLPQNNISVYFRADNAGVKTCVAKYSYNSKWHTADLGTWFVYLDSDMISRDMIANFDLETLGEKDAQKLQSQIKEAVDGFFKNKNNKYTNFLDKLKNEDAYPYKEVQSSQEKTLQQSVFDKTAYLIEDEKHLIEGSNDARGLVYSLLNKAIESGEAKFVFENVVKLSENNYRKIHDLIDTTDLDQVIGFSSSVAKKLKFLDFLYQLTYGDISKYLLERKQLHKIVERELWIFGDGYIGQPALWSDKNLSNNLDELQRKYLSSDPKEDEGNLDNDLKDNCKDITDLFFYDMKQTGQGKHTVTIVELKAPRCKISEKEISQVRRYAHDIIYEDKFNKRNVKFKIILISSKISDYARTEIDSLRNNNKRDAFCFQHFEENGSDIDIYIMTWSELIDHNRLQLSYMSDTLKMKEESVHEIFEREYPELLTEKTSARLTKQKLE